MKKGRPALQVSALAPPEAAAAVERAFFRNSTTLGVRRQPVGARRAGALVRQGRDAATVRCGSSSARSTARCWARTRSSRTAAASRRARGVPVREVIAAAAAAARAPPRRRLARRKRSALA